MNINTNPVASSNASSQSSSASSQSSATGSATADSSMFMTLLVAQLKNQDPMQPQDGTAFVAQLAQFNSLDNLIGIRQSMDQLVAALSQPQSSSQPSTSTDSNSTTDSII